MQRALLRSSFTNGKERDRSRGFEILGIAFFICVRIPFARIVVLSASLPHSERRDVIQASKGQGKSTNTLHRAAQEIIVNLVFFFSIMGMGVCFFGRHCRRSNSGFLDQGHRFGG